METRVALYQELHTWGGICISNSVNAKSQTVGHCQWHSRIFHLQQTNSLCNLL